MKIRLIYAVAVIGLVLMVVVALRALTPNIKAIINGKATITEFKDLFIETQKKAEQGNAEVQYELGMMYLRGKGVLGSENEAKKWFSISAEQGHVKSKCRLILIDKKREVFTQDDSDAIMLLTEIAEQGDAEAQVILSRMCYWGQGVVQDYKDAVKWATNAAEQENAEAQTLLGLMYYTGEGVPQDYKEAAKWFTKVADQNYASVKCFLGTMYEQGQGVSQDYKEAGKWYTKAAEQGHAEAQYRLGWMYRNRKIGSNKNMWRDYSEALPWFTKAAEQGHAAAQNDLGAMYYEGIMEGELPDYKQAIKWYTKAAEQGNAYAQNNLGLMYYEGKGVVEDYKKAFELFIKAAEQGNPSAQYKLGDIYASGEVVTKNNVESYKWFLLAGMNGIDVSKMKEMLKKDMTLDQIVLAQEMAMEFVETGKSDKMKDSEGILAGLVTTGTGFFVTQEGHLVTAAHIVNDTAEIIVIWDGQELPATVIVMDKELDIAILKIKEKKEFVCVSLIESSEVKTGEAVFTVGFPQIQIQGIEPKYTDGSISALTGIGNNPKFFQISVPVQPGNSGGPLIDSKGHVIGVVVSQLDDMQMLQATGSIPQNVNYALKGSSVLSFLKSVLDVSGKLEKPKDMTKEEAIEKSKKAVAIVVCSQQ